MREIWGKGKNKTKRRMGEETKPYELGSSLADWDEEQEKIEKTKRKQKTVRDESLNDGITKGSYKRINEGED